jgi:GH15 family glucan-1,4-alpha-glucosidase
MPRSRTSPRRRRSCSSGPLSLILGPTSRSPASIESTARDFDERTHDHWIEWVRSLSIPFEWQDEVIRAAIALKLCAFEETGAIVAALTTSIPEAPGSGRNWDYRYCWLRDAYFVIQVLNRLGATRTMEGFLSYISTLAATAGESGLQPLYGIGLESALDEREARRSRGSAAWARCGSGTRRSVSSRTTSTAA